MSGVYWGIVVGLVALVATLLGCIELSYPKAKGSPTAPSGRIDKPVEAVKQASVSYRQAA